jgi:hypothetical protein
MNTLITLIAKIIVAPLIFTLSIAGYDVQRNIVPTPTITPKVQTLGSYNPSGGGTYRLRTTAGSTDTQIQLSSFKEPVSNIAYTMTVLNSSVGYGTLDPQTSKSEFISFTGIIQNSDGTAILTGVTRGLARSYPYTASSTLRQPHAGQSIFILSDSPQHFNEYAVKQNDETITGDWKVGSPINATSIANRNYVDGKIFGGIGNASETATGTVQIATGLQTASSTSNGTLGRLVIPASLSTSTYNSATAPLKVVVTQNSGKIDDNFISTSTLFTNLSLATTTNIGSFPAFQIGKNTRIITTIGTSTFSVPSGVTTLQVEIQASGGNGVGPTCSGVNQSCGGPGGSAGGYAIKTVDVTGTTSIQVFISNPGTETWATFGTNGYYFYATDGKNSSGTTVGDSGIGVNGDLNIKGQLGSMGTPVTTTLTTVSGIGGSSMFGFGGGYCAMQFGAVINGASGTGYGSGGGGGCSSQAGGTATAGAGTQGMIKVTW